MRVVSSIVAAILLESSLWEARTLLEILKMNKGQSEIDLRNAQSLVSSLERRIATMNECSFEATEFCYPSTTTEKQEDEHGAA